MHIKLKKPLESKYEVWKTKGKKGPLSTAILTFFFPILGFYLIGQATNLIKLVVTIFLLIFFINSFIDITAILLVIADNGFLTNIVFAMYGYKKAKEYKERFEREEMRNSSPRRG